MTAFIVIACVIIVIFGVMHIGWVKSEIGKVHTRIDAEVEAISDDMKSTHKVMTDKVSSISGVANNALSSAQRAESKVVKVLEGNNKQEDNA